MLPHNILGLLSPTFIRLRSEWEMPWSPCVRLNYAQNPAPLRLPQMAGRLFGMQFLPPSRAIAHFGSANCPVAYQGLKIITPLRLRFPDFKRTTFAKIFSMWFSFFDCHSEMVGGALAATENVQTLILIPTYFR
ncbi:hypothetical protein BMR04_00055 [Methylococcaceae bacterium HT3]|nr:hypothetical protein BMR04_00055 [Methylococcaceae bacterium HT3]TXL22329.1 hypothetical protein BMR03_08965 [Methylococcaceae bacterium HT2]